MKKARIVCLLVVMMSVNLLAQAQNKIEIIVKDSLTNELLIGVSVSVKGTTLGTTTDANGLAKLNNVPQGAQTIVVSFIGYAKLMLNYSFPLHNVAQPITVSLLPEAEEMEEITVTAMRNNSRIEDLPTKIEVLGLDDMTEENTIRPANISSLLGDIGGIQMQQTSASSGNMNARIQGLNGRYSQVLKDGMPLYGGFSGSFSILQVPPLDLRQIEIIKGSASTLFGGDAIGGIINLVSKRPSAKPETNILINQTSLNETDINTYLSRKYDKLGFTLFAGHVYQNPVDVNSDGFTDAPRLRNYTIHPKLFVYLDKNTTLSAGINSIYEDRKGGDMYVVKHSVTTDHQYFVTNKSFRNSGEIMLEKKMDDGSQLTFKGSTSLLDRSLETSSYTFSALQTLYFSELSYFLKRDNYDVVMGANLSGDKFNKDKAARIAIDNYHYTTLGLFAQNDWRITEKMLVESGLRYDYHSSRGGYVLPHVSFMYKFLPAFTARLNGGMGYKVPIIFSYINEEADLTSLISNQASLKTETSKGVNLDVNYNTSLAPEVSLTLNQSFFYTLLDHPVVYNNVANKVSLFNADKPVETKGLQTYTRLVVHEIEFYMSYVYTHAVKQYDDANPYFLATPKHNFATTITYEPNKKYRIGIEASYIGRQVIEDNAKTPSYGFLALMAERKFEHFSVVLNCENLLDYRQKNFVIPPVTNPTFKTIWAPIDGRVINLSVNIKL